MVASKFSDKTDTGPMLMIVQFCLLCLGMEIKKDWNQGTHIQSIH